MLRPQIVYFFFLPFNQIHLCLKLRLGFLQLSANNLIGILTFLELRLSFLHFQGKLINLHLQHAYFRGRTTFVILVSFGGSLSVIMFQLTVLALLLIGSGRGIFKRRLVDLREHAAVSLELVVAFGKQRKIEFAAYVVLVDLEVHSLCFRPILD